MVYQYRVEWAGTTGGPGVTVLNARLTGLQTSEQVQAFANKTRAWFEAFKAHFPNEVRWTFPPEVFEFNTSSGQLEDIHQVTAPAQVLATHTGGYIHAAGARVDWGTSAILNGRRLRGRTFLVPCAASNFGPDGIMTAGVHVSLQDKANAYLADLQSNGSLCVWSRTHGLLADVQSATVDKKGAVLRSRRD